MEKIEGIDIFQKKEIKIKKEDDIVVFVENGKAYLSAYNGEQPLTFERVMVNMLPFFETFKINESARPLYVSCVLNAKFSARRLNDAIVAISMDNTLDKFTPKPGDIVRYDRKGERLFNSSEALNMSECIARIYYNGQFNSLCDAVKHTMNLIFSHVGNSNGVMMYNLTEYGKTHYEKVIAFYDKIPSAYLYKNNKNEYE